MHPDRFQPIPLCCALLVAVALCACEPSTTATPSSASSQVQTGNKPHPLQPEDAQAADDVQPRSRQKMAGTGQEPNRQQIGETGQAPNRQKMAGTGQEPNRQEIEEPGLYPLDKSWALALRTGLKDHEVSAILQQSLEQKTLRMSSTRREQRELRGERVEVRTQELFPLKKSELDRLRLTFFEQTLVGILLIYKEGNAQRVVEYMKRYGEPARAEGWIGWWLAELDLLVQASPDGVLYELFDLAAARPMIPFISELMATSWQQRYGSAPP
ncbi:MAG: hypothetical protein RBU37_13495 [Myxococcota bacterium]|nr:hypothetical protein [Myxococcota bacterium]